MALAHKFPKMCLQFQSWIWLCRNFARKRNGVIVLALDIICTVWVTASGSVNTVFPLSSSWHTTASVWLLIYTMSKLSPRKRINYWKWLIFGEATHVYVKRYPEDVTNLFCFSEMRYLFCLMIAQTMCGLSSCPHLLSIIVPGRRDIETLKCTSVWRVRLSNITVERKNTFKLFCLRRSQFAQSKVEVMGQDLARPDKHENSARGSTDRWQTDLINFTTQKTVL